MAFKGEILLIKVVGHVTHDILAKFGKILVVNVVRVAKKWQNSSYETHFWYKTMTYDPKMVSNAKISLIQIVRHLKIYIETKFRLIRERYEVRRAKKRRKMLIMGALLAENNDLWQKEVSNANILLIEVVKHLKNDHVTKFSIYTLRNVIRRNKMAEIIKKSNISGNP